MPRQYSTLIAGAAALLITGLAGCSAAIPGGIGHSEKPPTASPSSGADAIVRDPLSEYLFVDMSDFDEEMKRSEDVMKQCMEDQGFEYTSMAMSQDEIGGFEESPLGFFIPRDWAENNGFGIVDERFPARGAESRSEPEEEPNEAYRNRLSEAELEAYWKAWWGEAYGAKSTEGFTSDQLGCQGEAMKSVSSRSDHPRPPIIDEAFEFLNSLRDHPRIAALEKTVQQCAVDLGYGTAYVDALRTKVHDYRLEHPSAVREDPDVARLKTEEVDAALAEWDCRETTGYFADGAAALAELEKDYIAEHQKELEEAQLWLNQ